MRGTRLIQLSFEHPDRDIATEVTGALISNYKELDSDQRLKAASSSLEYLQREQERLKKQLSDSEEELSGYTRNLGSVSVDDELNIIADQLKELNTRLTIAKTDRLKLEADYDQIQNVRDDPKVLLQIESVSRMEEVQRARSSLNEIDGEIGKMRERYGQNSPQFGQLLSQREGLQQALYAEALRAPKSVEISLRAAIQNEKSLERETKNQEMKTIDVKDLAIKSSVMRRQIEADNLAFRAVCERLNDEESQARSQATFLQIVDPPSPAVQVKPRPVLVVALAILGALALSAGTILLLAILDTSLKSVDETEQFLGVHVLAAIPQMTAGGKRKDQEQAETSMLARIPLLEDPHSTVSESFRTLRASLLLLEDEQPFMLMTSAIPGEGKSFCSINLAAAMAQQGMRTVIIDADLRKPVLEERMFGAAGSHMGLTDFLMGRADFADLIRETQIPNLFAITGGSRYANRSELLLRQQRFEEFLNKVGEEFDRAIVDSAPILAVSDTLNIARHFKTIALVIRSHKTARRLTRRASDLLARAGHPICGTVLNAVPARGSAYYYYYAHSKGGQAYGTSESEISGSRAGVKS
ncbi:MAG: polysaccharide biosynthesis tyrosine autokinase [Terrimicrobiaceae bacterium]|nr:polysaccharide biosynthesis tyrosine autokinase [Terrimicrobiaceae bacterium]